MTVPHFQSANEGGNLRAPGVSETGSGLLGSAGNHADENPTADSYSILDRVLDFCGFDNFTPDGAEHYIVEYPFIENDYYLDMLLSFGQACECLAPTRIREELKRRAQAIAAMYE